MKMKLKKITSILVTAILLLSAFAMNLNAADKLTLEVKKGTPVIDGVEDDVWNYTDAVVVGRIKESGDTPNDGSGVSGTFKLLWDESNLYAIVFVKDNTRYNNGNANHTQDSVEMFFDPLNTITETYDGDDFRFCLGADDVYNDEHKEVAVVHKVVNKSDSYILEFAIPISSVVDSFKFAAGTTFGWDIQLNDSTTNSDTRNHCLGWNDDANQSWQNATYLGTLVLSAEEAAAPVVEIIEAPAEVAEEPAATVTVAPPAPVKAAQTSDMGIIIALSTLLTSGAAIIISKKKR